MSVAFSPWKKYSLSPRKNYARNSASMKDPVVQGSGIPNGSENVGPVAEIGETKTPIEETVLLTSSHPLYMYFS
jgi:hypothetical protein